MHQINDIVKVAEDDHLWFIFLDAWLLPVADPGFSPGGAPTPKSAIIFQFFAKNCMKMKEFGPPEGGRASLAPPLDPPMVTYNLMDMGN